MKTKKLLYIAFLNITIVICEIIFGIFANSLALITDALHNLGDVLALGVAFVAAYYSGKEPNEKMTFGFVRAEMMAAFVNSAFLCITMIFVLFESIKRVLNPQEIQAGYVIWVALVALIANSISAYLLHGDHHHEHNHSHNHGHSHEDLNIKSAYLHMLGDAAISLGVIIGGIITLYANTPYIDPIISIFFSLYIFKSSFDILKTSFASLMDSNSENIQKYEKLLLEFDEIVSIHDIHISSPSSNDKYFSAHIVVDKNPTLSEIEELIEKIRAKLRNTGITHALIQPESMKYSNPNGYCCSH